MGGEYTSWQGQPGGSLAHARNSGESWAGDTSTRHYFGATHHTLSGRFLTYWLRHEGSLLLGPPISEPFRARNGDGSGRDYLLQYFTNGRLEYHPALGSGHDVSLGLLGSEYLHAAGLR